MRFARLIRIFYKPSGYDVSSRARGKRKKPDPAFATQTKKNVPEKDGLFEFGIKAREILGRDRFLVNLISGGRVVYKKKRGKKRRRRFP